MRIADDASKDELDLALEHSLRQQTLLLPRVLLRILCCFDFFRRRFEIVFETENSKSHLTFSRDAEIEMMYRRGAILLPCCYF